MTTTGLPRLKALNSYFSYRGDTHTISLLKTTLRRVDTTFLRRQGAWALAHGAQKRGSSDNVTVMVARLPPLGKDQDQDQDLGEASTAIGCEPKPPPADAR